MSTSTKKGKCGWERGKTGRDSEWYQTERLCTWACMGGQLEELDWIASFWIMANNVAVTSVFFPYYIDIYACIRDASSSSSLLSLSSPPCTHIFSFALIFQFPVRINIISAFFFIWKISLSLFVSFFFSSLWSCISQVTLVSFFSLFSTISFRGKLTIK